MIDYARRHGHRVRNLHDGLPVPPVRPRHLPDHRPAYVGAADRLDATACRHGYAYAYGDKLGWVLLCTPRRGLGQRLGAIRDIRGVIVRQSGDAESAGEAPLEAADRVLDVLKPYRRRPPSAGRSAKAMRSLRRRRPPAGAGIMAQVSTQAASPDAESLG